MRQRPPKTAAAHISHLGRIPDEITPEIWQRTCFSGPAESAPSLHASGQSICTQRASQDHIRVEAQSGTLRGGWQPRRGEAAKTRQPVNNYSARISYCAHGPGPKNVSPRRGRAGHGTASCGTAHKGTTRHGARASTVSDRTAIFRSYLLARRTSS